jgi:hypothetical protein
MARNTTTLSAACLSTDTFITVASATGIVAGQFAICDNEIMQVRQNYGVAPYTSTLIPVVRGFNSTAQVAHPKTANVIFQLGSDFAATATGTEVPAKPNFMTYTTYSYSASATVATGQAQFTTIILNGTSALTMLVADPTTDQDGQILLVLGNGKAAHTFATVTTGHLNNGGAGYTTLTFASGANVGVWLVAANGYWNLINSAGIAGTATNVLATIT